MHNFPDDMPRGLPEDKETIDSTDVSHFHKTATDEEFESAILGGVSMLTQPLRTMETGFSIYSAFALMKALDKVVKQHLIDQRK